MTGFSAGRSSGYVKNPARDAAYCQLRPRVGGNDCCGCEGGQVTRHIASFDPESGTQEDLNALLAAP